MRDKLELQLAANKLYDAHTPEEIAYIIKHMQANLNRHFQYNPKDKPS